MVYMVIMDNLKEITSILKSKSNQRLVAVLIFLWYTCLFSNAQNEGWQVYPAYSEAVQVEAAGNYLYCIMKGSGTVNSKTGNLIRYDVEDGSVQTYDCLNTLNDKEIAHISYNKTTERLIIVYATGTIDLLDNDDEVVNLTALRDASIFAESINFIYNRGKYAYLCVDFGIIELDTELGVIRETYRVGASVVSMQSIGEKIYVARKDGLFMIDAVSTMHDRNSWHKLSDEEFKELQAFANQLYALNKNNRLHYLLPDASGIKVVASSYYFTKIQAHSETLLCTDAGSWMALFNPSSPQHPIIIQQKYKWNDEAILSDVLYVCDPLVGLMSYKYNPEESVFIPLSSEALFSVDSPRRDLFYHMKYEDERLLIAGGINTQSAAYYPVTFMFMSEDKGETEWTLFDEVTPRNDYPKLSHNNCVDLVQDPNDDKHFYGAVSRNGLHEYRMTDDGNVRFEKIHNYLNSPLRCINVDTPTPWNYCTCTALQYDDRGNLWMANQQTDTIVRLIRPDGRWISLYYPEIVGAENVLQYLLSSQDVNFLVTYAGGRRGFFGFDTNGTLNVSDDDRHLLRTTITNQDGTTVLPNHFNCMVEDMEQQIWCGTDAGLFVITNPQEWFDDDFRFHQIKINRDDDSGLADYLLAGVEIKCVAVDQANRKWIGTTGNGVYLVSPDGQETICHFTREDSPLLSNNIHSIAINHKTGRVMFGTDLGLCSYDARVTKVEDSLADRNNIIAYPNPVRPNTDAGVTINGLTNDAEVKIVSSSGKVVWGSKSLGGSVYWNCRNISGDRVPSGVYHVVCNTEDASQTVVTRIVVLK